MGSCFDKKKSQPYQIQTVDSQTNINMMLTLDRDRFCQDPNTLNTYNFVLTNIKVKLKDLRICKIIFDIANISTYESPVSNEQSGRHIFKPEFQTSVQITEENLRKTFLAILIKDLKNETISNLDINLYDVATGPPHFDYDFQLYQKVSIKIIHLVRNKGYLNWQGQFRFEDGLSSSDIVEGWKNCLHNGRKFGQTSIQVFDEISGINIDMTDQTYTHTFLSDYSKVFINPAYIKQTQLEYSPSEQLSEDFVQESQVGNSQMQSSGPSLARKPSKLNLVMFNDHQTKANFKQLQWDDENGILLDIEVPINQIPASSLQLCFWGVHVNDSNKNEDISPSNKKKQTTKVAKNQDDETTPTLKEQEDYTLICETYISLNQIFKHGQEEKFELEDGVRVYQYTVAVEKGLWDHGQKVGTMICDFHIKVPAFINQPIVGVRTNKNIQQGSSVINESYISVKEISDLASHLQKLTDSVFKLQFHVKNLTGLERMNLREILNAQIYDIIIVLQQSHKESIMSFYYKSQSELFKAQDILLKLAHHLISTADNLDDSTRERYYLMLMLIMNRGELALNQMGFSENTQKTSQKFYKLKLDVGLSYQHFLYTTLKIVLEKLKQKAYSVNERIFIESFCARAFFQIPEFRSRFSACLVHPDDPPLIEWRGTHFDLEMAQDENEYHNKDLIDLFDWEINFYSYLEKEQKGRDNRLILKEILDQPEWQKRFGKRGLAFFMFLREWCIHVDKNVVVKEHIPWQDIPGYRSLVKAFLIELKTKDILQFPDAMKQALFSLLYNEGLLNIVIVLLFNKTNLFHSESVIELFEILNEALQYIVKHNKKLPTQVDLVFFMRGIRTVLNDCEHAFCISKCIWMLHNNYTIFPIEFKKDLCDLIFPKLAPKFFAHWSQNVRLIFHHFMIFRIYHLHRSKRSPDVNEEALLIQYQQVIRPKKQQSFFDSNRPQNQIISDYIYMKYFRVIQMIEQSKQICTQRHESAGLEERSYYKAMRHKLMSIKMDQFKQKMNQSNQDELLKNNNSEKEVLLFMDNNDTDISKQQQSSNALQLQKSDLNIQKLNQPNIQSKKIHRQDSQIQVPLQESELKYLLKACTEFEDLKNFYIKWKEQMMNKYKSIRLQKDTDEERELLQERFDIPIVNLQLPIDEREGNISNDDDW